MRLHTAKRKKRKTAVAAAVITALLWVGFAFPVSAGKSYVVVTGEPVNVRRGAGMSYASIGKAHKGSQYVYITEKKDANGQIWYQVQFSKTQNGWIIHHYADVTKDSAAAKATTQTSAQTSAQISANSAVKQVTVTGTTVNVRAGIGTSFSKIGLAKKGSSYPFLSQKKDSSGVIWYQIQFSKNKKGWITSKYSKLTYSSATGKTTSPTSQKTSASTTGRKTSATSQKTSSTTTGRKTSATSQKTSASTTGKTTSPTSPQSFVNAVAQKYHAVGVQVAVIEKGKVTKTYHYGYATKPSIPMTSDHKIRAASLSKVVVAMNAMKMQEEGIVALDEDIGTYWDTKTYQKTTLRQLLTHTSFFKGNSYIQDRERTIAQLQSADSYRASNSWMYNNYGVGIAGSTLEMAYGNNLNIYANSRFFKPLGIDAAFASGNVADKSKLATLYYPSGNTWRSTNAAQKYILNDIGCNTGYFAGGLTISAKDLAKLTAILANDGTYNGKRFLSASSVKAMETPCINAFARGYGFKQCMPLRMQTNLYGQNKMYYHQGFAYGTISFLGYNPTTKNGVVIITTGASQVYDNREIYCVCGEIAQHILDPS